MERRTKVILLIIVVLLVALALVVILLASMRKNDVDPADSPSSSSVDTPTPEDLLPSINDPVYEGKDISASPFVGSFKNSYVSLYASKAEDVFAIPEEIPLLTVNADGSFELKIYDAEAGSLALRGTVTVDGETATFSVEQRPEGINFLGDDVEGFKMTLADESNMRYSGEPLGSISKGDVFTREASA